jgi:hypothetical protein
MNNNNNNTFTRDVGISRADFELMLERYFNPSLVSAGKETVLWNKDSVMNQVNENLAKVRANEQSNNEYITDGLSQYAKWRKENEGLNKLDDI